MTRPNAVTGYAFAAVLALAPVAPALAQENDAPTDLSIGYLDLANDPRFDPVLAYYQVPPSPWGRSVAGARLGIDDAQAIGEVIGVDFALREHSANSVETMTGVLEDWVAEGTHFVVVDLTADQLLSLSDAVSGLPVTLFNVSAQEDSLRADLCRDNLVHTIPSFRMQTDALTQYLVLKQWTDILVLQGPLEADQAIVDALEESVRFFGANIVEVRPFVLSADPRDREQNNVALATGGIDYDVVFVADSDGEFARQVPYTTNPPRPVVGAAGLVPQAWHWTWEQQGAAQVNDRFEDLNEGRHMHSFDWAAWAAVRAVTQSVLRTDSTDYDTVRQYLLSDRLTLDGSKGRPMSIRPWDHQMRQEILLSAGNVVVDAAPIRGFLHDTNDLDTLGADAPRSACTF